MHDDAVSRLDEIEFHERFHPPFQCPSQAVERVERGPKAAVNPLNIAAGVAAARFTLEHVAQWLGEPWAAYSPARAAEIAADLAGIAAAVGAASGALAARVGEIGDRGELGDGSDVAAACSALGSAARGVPAVVDALTVAALDLSGLPYCGYVPVGLVNLSDVVVRVAEELRRRGVEVTETVLPVPGGRVDGRDPEVGFAHRGVACGLRLTWQVGSPDWAGWWLLLPPDLVDGRMQERGWDVRMPVVGEELMSGTLAHHPCQVVEVALAAVEGFAAERAVGASGEV